MKRPDRVTNVSVGNHSNQINWNRDYGGWLSGCVLTPHGTVSVLSQGFDGNSHKLPRLDFAIAGRQIIWSYDECYRTKTLVSLAKGMAKELHEQYLGHLPPVKYKATP